MRIDSTNLKQLCRTKRIRLQALLKEAGVSRTAYYSLTRKESVLPKSVCRIAQRLGVSPLRFLNDPSDSVKRIRELQIQTDTICRRYPECDRDVVFRTLMNLDLPPIERLRKALIRGRQPHLQR
jgi:transcriptional regulator with XRE-family HTH domain